jgi:hypothetical protein
LGFIPAEGELIYTTDANEVWVGDGVTVGGVTVTGAVEPGLLSVSEDTEPTLGGDLDINGNSIIGSGSINIVGGASIAGDTVFGTDLLNEFVVNSSVSTLIPSEGSNLGSETAVWNSVYADAVVTSNINAGTIELGDNIELQSRTLYDSASDRLVARNIVVEVISAETVDSSVVINNDVYCSGGIDAQSITARAELAIPSSVIGEFGTTYFITNGVETTTLDDADSSVIKMLVAKDVSAGPMTVTVISAGWTGSSGTITFDTNGQGCTLQFIEDAWYCVGNNGAVFA